MLHDRDAHKKTHERTSQGFRCASWQRQAKRFFSLHGSITLQAQQGFLGSNRRIVLSLCTSTFMVLNIWSSWLANNIQHKKCFGTMISSLALHLDTCGSFTASGFHEQWPGTFPRILGKASTLSFCTQILAFESQHLVITCSEQHQSRKWYRTPTLHSDSHICFTASCLHGQPTASITRISGQACKPVPGAGHQCLD